MGSTYRPWRYAGREEYREFQAKAFRNNASIVTEEAQQRVPEPSPRERLDAVATGETKKPRGDGGGGFFGALRDAAGEVAHGAKVVGENLISGEKFQETLGIDTGYMDSLRKKGLLGKAAALGLDTITAPLTVATIGAGPALSAGIKGATAGTRLATAGRAAAALASPALEGPIARRAAGEVAAGVGAGLASEGATSVLPEGTPGPLRAAVGIGAGLVGGVGALQAPRAASAAKDAAVRGAARVQASPLGQALTEEALRGTGVRAPAPAAGVIDATNPHMSAYEDVLIRHDIPYRVDEWGAIEILDRDRAEAVMADLQAAHADKIQAIKVQGEAAQGGFEGDVQYETRPDGTRQAIRKGGRTPGYHAFHQRYAADAAAHADMEDATRIYQILDEGRVVDASEEELRQPWRNGPLVEPPDLPPLQADYDAKKVAKGKGSVAARDEAGVKLGVAQADDYVAQRSGEGFSPYRTLADIDGELENLRVFSEWASKARKGEEVGYAGGVPQRAYAERLKQWREAIVEKGHDVAHTDLDGAGTASVGVVPRGAPGVGEGAAAAGAARGDAGARAKGARKARGGGVADSAAGAGGAAPGDVGLPTARPVERSSAEVIADQRARRDASGRPSAEVIARQAEQRAQLEAAEAPIVSGERSSAEVIADQAAAKRFDPRLPRPDGEPRVFPAPDGSGATVDRLRQRAPAGYRLNVPKDRAPEYRRVLTNEDMTWLEAHPEQPPIGGPKEARKLFKGYEDLTDLADGVAALIARYHSKWNRPTPTLAQDWRDIRRAAVAKFRDLHVADTLAQMGEDSLKGLSPDVRKQVTQGAWRDAKAAVKDLEDEITREEWWSELAPHKGEGVEGRPTGGVGGTVTQPEFIPGAVNPPVTPGGTWNRTRGTPPLGGDDQPVDLLGTRQRKTVLAEAAEKQKKPLSQAMQRLKSALGRLESADVREKVDPILAEKNRIDNVITHQVELAVTLERAKMRLAGLEVKAVEDGSFHLFANGRDVGLFEDVVEQVSDKGRAALASLDDAQREALGQIGETNRLFNGTKHFHAAKVSLAPDILGDYFGRRVLTREYVNQLGETVTIERGQSGQPSRSVGANRLKPRVLESVEAGMAKGFKYENPWEARAAILRGKLLDAEDGYLKRNLGGLRVRDPGSTFGLGQVSGHPGFNGMWFEPKVAERIQRGLDTQQKGPLRSIEALNSVLTPLRASFDLSATWQQGMRAWLTDPKMAGEYWWGVARSLKDPKVYDGMLLRLNDEGPGISYLLERGLRFTGEGAEGEFFVPRRIVEATGRAGVVGKGLNTGFNAANQHFGRLLNSYRIKFANDQYERLVAAGLEGAELDAAMRQSADGINRMFGWTHSKPSTWESVLLFAPRYTRASIETLMAAVSKGGIEGDMARKHLGLLLAEGAGIVWLLNEARGYETEFDPRDPNFLRLRNVGGLDVSPFGTYNTLFRALAQTAAGDPTGDGLPNPAAVGKFIEGKLSPAAGALYYPLKGETYLGEPLEPTAGPAGLGKTALELGKSNLPFGLQNLVSEGPAAALVGSTGLSASPLTPAEQRDLARSGSPGGLSLPIAGHVDVTGRRTTGEAQALFGQEYEALSGEQKAQVNERPSVAGPQAEVDRRAIARGGDRGMAAQIRQQVKTELDGSAAFLAASRDASGKPYTGNDFRKAYNDTMLRAAGARRVLGAFSGGDADVNGWFRLFEQATMQNGQTDYDRLERLQAEYEAAHPGVQEKVERESGIRDNAAVRQLREAKQQAKAYYAIPAYRGMTVEEGEKAGEFVALASDLVATGRARNRMHALALLRGFDPEGATLALRATRVGANPARKAFRQQNPLFAKFYYDSIAQLAA